jgi:phosphatidylserine/phosphatidylglycerophosphate/cardiolipin synthase-like enzyme
MTKGLVRRIALVALLLGLTGHAPAAVAADVTVCFAPPLRGGCDPTNTTIQTLGAAQHQILVQAYEFSSAPIAKAIVEAHRRGVDVRVILDKSNEHEGYSASKFLQHEGVPVMIDSAHNIAHNKVMIVDGETVITGSFNFTKSGEDQNAENLVVIRDAGIATTYLRNWNDHLAHSHPPGTGPIARDTARPKIVAGQVVGNRSTRIFAWPGCASFDTMIPGHRVVFENRQAAESAGYHAAKNCPD